jgi:hypothetical protein
MKRNNKAGTSVKYSKPLCWPEALINKYNKTPIQLVIRRPFAKFKSIPARKVVW